MRMTCRLMNINSGYTCWHRRYEDMIVSRPLPFCLLPSILSVLLRLGGWRLDCLARALRGLNLCSIISTSYFCLKTDKKKREIPNSPIAKPPIVHPHWQAWMPTGCRPAVEQIALQQILFARFILYCRKAWYLNCLLWKLRYFLW